MAAFLLTSTAVVSGRFPWSHHWLFPFHEWLLLAQAALIRRAPAVPPLTGLSLLVLAVAVARLETIWLAHHVVHFALTFGIAAGHHRLLAEASPEGAWRRVNRWYGGTFALVAVAAAILAWRQGIWWGLRDGT